MLVKKEARCGDAALTSETQVHDTMIDWDSEKVLLLLPYDMWTMGALPHL